MTVLAEGGRNMILMTIGGGGPSKKTRNQYDVIYVLGVGKHTKSCFVPHFPLVWNSRSHLPENLEYFDKNCTSNRANQILEPAIKN